MHEQVQEMHRARRGERGRHTHRERSKKNSSQELGECNVKLNAQCPLKNCSHLLCFGFVFHFQFSNLAVNFIK